MRTRIALVVGALIALTFGALGQSVVQQTLSGNETWSAGQGPGGPSGFITSNLVRNSSAIAITSGSGSATSVMTNAQSTIVWTGAAPTSWSVTLPPTPSAGQIVRLGTTTTLTTMLNVSAAAGTSLATAVSSATLTAQTSMVFQYYEPTKTWYQVQL